MSESSRKRHAAGSDSTQGSGFISKLGGFFSWLKHTGGGGSSSSSSSHTNGSVPNVSKPVTSKRKRFGKSSLLSGGGAEAGPSGVPSSSQLGRVHVSQTQLVRGAQGFDFNATNDDVVQRLDDNEGASFAHTVRRTATGAGKRSFIHNNMDDDDDENELFHSPPVLRNKTEHHHQPVQRRRSLFQSPSLRPNLSTLDRTSGQRRSMLDEYSFQSFTGRNVIKAEPDENEAVGNLSTMAAPTPSSARLLTTSSATLPRSLRIVSAAKKNAPSSPTSEKPEEAVAAPSRPISGLWSTRPSAIPEESGRSSVMDSSLTNNSRSTTAARIAAARRENNSIGLIPMAQRHSMYTSGSFNLGATSLNLSSSNSSATMAGYQTRLNVRGSSMRQPPPLVNQNASIGANTSGTAQRLANCFRQGNLASGRIPAASFNEIDQSTGSLLFEKPIVIVDDRRDEISQKSSPDLLPVSAFAPPKRLGSSLTNGPSPDISINLAKPVSLTNHRLLPRTTPSSSKHVTKPAWTCPMCDFSENAGTFMKCCKCEVYVRPASLPSASMVAGLVKPTWQCCACLALNSAPLPGASKACKSCLIVQNDDCFPAITSSSWSCYVCGKSNEACFVKCSSCTSFYARNANSVRNYAPPMESRGSSLIPSSRPWQCVSCLAVNSKTSSNCCQCSKKRLHPPSVTPANPPKQEPVSNQHSPAIPASTSKVNEKPSLSEMFKAKTDQWECPVCMVRNKKSDPKCVSCESPQPKTIEWTCAMCQISNKPEKTKCVACETPKEGSSIVSSPMDTSASNTFVQTKKSDEWDCPTCDLRNKAGTAKCVSCETTSPVSFTSTFVRQKPAGSWDCPTCDISNQASASKCISCETPNPKKASQPKPASSTTGGLGPSILGKVPSTSGAATFKFGMSSATTAVSSTPKVEPTPFQAVTWSCEVCKIQNKATASQCRACDQPKPTTISKPAIKFGMASVPAKKEPPMVTFSPPRPTGPTSGRYGLDDDEVIELKEMYEWTCASCRFPNDESLVVCQSCHTHRPIVHKRKLKPTQEDGPSPAPKSLAFSLPGSTGFSLPAKQNANDIAAKAFVQPTVDQPRITPTPVVTVATTSSPGSIANKENVPSTPVTATFAAPTTATTPSFGGIAPIKPVATTSSAVSLPKLSFGSAAPIGSTPPETKPTATLPAFNFGTTPPVSSSPAVTIMSSSTPATTASIAPTFNFGTTPVSSGPAVATTSSATPVTTASIAPTFNFGTTPSSGPAVATTSSTPVTTASIAPTFNFGAAPKPASQPAVAQPTFSFGASSKTDSVASASTVTPSFSFGQSTATSSAASISAPATKPTFSFGSSIAPAAPATTTAVANVAPTFNFGSTFSKPTLATTTAASLPKPTFSFGSSLGQPATTTSSMTTKVIDAPVFSFGGTGDKRKSDDDAKFDSVKLPLFSGATAQKNASTTNDIFGGGAAKMSTGSSPFGGLSGSAPSQPQTKSPFTFGSSTSGQTNGDVDMSTGSTPANNIFGASANPAPSGTIFGSSTNTAPSTGGFNFGSTAQSTPSPFGNTSAAAPSSGGFNFGASPAAPAPAPASGGFQFGASSTPVAGGFNFGSAPAPSAGGFNFGAAPQAPPSGSGGFNFGSTGGTTAPPTSSENRPVIKARRRGIRR